MKDLRIIDLQVHLFDFLHAWPSRTDAVGAEREFTYGARIARVSTVTGSNKFPWQEFSLAVV